MSVLALRSEDLGRRAPPAAWEAYLLIGIFPEASRIRWCKFHVFSGGRPGRHCLSAAEALDGPPERLLLIATSDGIEREHRVLDADELERSRDGFGVHAPGVAFGGEFPELALDAPRAKARFNASDMHWWARLPRLLSYFSAFGSLEWETPDGTPSGLGLAEHAWGADTRLDVFRLSPRRWQWDVLALDGGGFAAGLTLGGLVGAGTVARLPGEEIARGRTARVRVRAWVDQHGRRVPARWRGALGFERGELRYEARATTPVAPTLPDGGFLGFAFDGEFRPQGGAARSVRGTGFTEYRAG
jgi:hypothetical protein